MNNNFDTVNKTKSLKIQNIYPITNKSGAIMRNNKKKQNSLTHELSCKVRNTEVKIFFNRKTNKIQDIILFEGVSFMEVDISVEHLANTISIKSYTPRFHSLGSVSGKVYANSTKLVLRALGAAALELQKKHHCMATQLELIKDKVSDYVEKQQKENNTWFSKSLARAS